MASTMKIIIITLLFIGILFLGPGHNILHGHGDLGKKCSLCIFAGFIPNVVLPNVLVLTFAGFENKTKPENLKTKGFITVPPSRAPPFTF